MDWGQVNELLCVSLQDLLDCLDLPDLQVLIEDRLGLSDQKLYIDRFQVRPESVREDKTQLRVTGILLPYPGDLE